MVALIENALSLSGEPTPAAKVSRIRRELEDARITLPDAAELVAALLGIPGVSLPPVSGELRLERIIDVLVSWISAESRRQPLVMLIEDLHWCDPTTIDTLTLLLIRLSEFPNPVLPPPAPSSNPRGKGPT